MSDIQKYMAGQNLTPKQKKEYLLKKYIKRDNADIDTVKRWAVYYTPSKLTEEDILNNSRIPQPRIICVTGTEAEARAEISWRLTFHLYNDTEIALKHDSKRFGTFFDETQHKDSHGREIQHQFDDRNPVGGFIDNSLTTQEDADGFRSLASYSNIVIDYAGTYYIQEIYVIQD